MKKKMQANEIMANAYWDIIESLEWLKDRNHKRVKKDFRKMELTGSQRENLTIFYRNRLKQLDGRVRINDILKRPEVTGWLSDDSWWDLRADIIGRGKDFFSSILENHDLLIPLINNNDYKENFGYAFHDFQPMPIYPHYDKSDIYHPGPLDMIDEEK